MAQLSVRPLPICSGMMRVVAIAIKPPLKKNSGLPKQTAVGIFYHLALILEQISN